MLHTLVTRKNASTLPLLPVDEQTFADWIKAQDRATRRWIERSEFEPRGNRVVVLPGPRGPARALLGRSDSGLWSWAGAAQRLPPGRYVIEGELDPAEATDAAVGWALSAYHYGRFKAASEKPRELLWPKGADRAEVRRLVEAVWWVRDLINNPADDLGPEELAAAAVTMGRAGGARTRVVAGRRLVDHFPAIHAVGRGSPRAPRLVDMRWGDPEHPKLTLVGKGVCFDSGGLDLKNPAGMLRMKKDMGGAAIVLGLARMVMDARLPVCLRVLIPAVENLPGPGAYRPLDVLKTRKGLTVEVSNTDAEGRLILADALAEADREAPDLLIDVATLTGSARLAIGTEITPFFSTERKLADDLATAARRVRDPVWRLPLHRGYRRHLDSRIADIKNAPSTNLAGAITAALFLQEFIERADRWLHLDVFAWVDNPKPGRPIGGEATGMRALWEMLKARYPVASRPPRAGR